MTTTIINKTLNSVSHRGVELIPTEGLVGIQNGLDSEVGKVCGIPMVPTDVWEPYNVPAPQKGVVYIVEPDVRQAMPTRIDLVSVPYDTKGDVEYFDVNPKVDWMETTTFKVLFFIILSVLMYTAFEVYFQMEEANTNGPQVIEDLFTK